MLAKVTLIAALLFSLGGTAFAEVDLPPEAQCYFDAVAAKDAEAVGACMSDDARILDVSREIEGREAIVKWAADEVIGGAYEVHELAWGKDGVQILLTFKPKGAAAGFKANYVMSLRGGKIATMALSYA
jgi:hypothetical protein